MKLIKADWLILIAFVLMLAIHFITQFLIVQNTPTEETRAEINALITYAEANPLAAYVLKFEKLRLIYSAFFVPAVFIASYYYIRQKFWHNQDLIMFFAIMVLTVMIMNFNNDLAALLGWLAR